MLYECSQTEARWYGNEAFLNQYIMFADQINDVSRANEATQRKQDLAASRVARTNKLFRLLDGLPEEFALKDVKKLLQENDMKPEGANTYINRWEDREMIMRSGKGFKKVLKES